jgi:DNA-binding transcriptional LysR family regulator
VSVDLGEMLRPDQFHALQSGLVDLGLMLQPIEEGNFSADPLWTEGCMVALPEAHPLVAATAATTSGYSPSGSRSRTRRSASWGPRATCSEPWWRSLALA